jgi:uncharacterized protein YodC (DUF2158 family)
MKNTAHNLNEVKALTKEMVISGDTEKYNGCNWYSHDGVYLCRTFTGSTMFHLELPNVTLETIRLE